MQRVDGRADDQLREIKITRNFITSATGSVLIEWGNTKVLCAATILPEVPEWLKGKGKGWLTAEYSMLPAAGTPRKPRERAGKIDGRTQEIQRIVGRVLRAAVDLEILNNFTVVVDCDVLQADGGTRCASVTGAYVALVDALTNFQNQGMKFPVNPLSSIVAGVSAGIVKGKVLLDLKYEEDSSSEVDLNVFMNNKGQIIEIQGTAEGAPFEKKNLDELLAISTKGLEKIFQVQKSALKDCPLVRDL